MTEKIPINDDESVKNMDIRLLLKQLEKGLEFAEIELEYIETEVNFLRDLKAIVESFNREIKQISTQKNKSDFKVVIFDGRHQSNSFSNFNAFENKQNDERAKLGNNLNNLMKKRYIISTHLE